MTRVKFVWKNRRMIWKYRRPLWTIYKHRQGLLAAAGVGIGFLGVRALDRTLGR